MKSQNVVGQLEKGRLIYCISSEIWFANENYKHHLPTNKPIVFPQGPAKRLTENVVFIKSVFFREG